MATKAFNRLFKQFIIFSFLFILSGFCSAESYTSINEQILNYNVKTVINKDGSIDVEETILYDFGPNQRHGIYRDIPFVKTNQDGKQFKMTFKDVKVEDHMFVKSSSFEELSIKIGDPDKYVSGIKQYKISYRVLGGLTYFSDHDELYWNFTGNEWNVPIGSFSGEIVFPEEVKQEDIKFICYTGVKGSTEQDCRARTSVENNKLSLLFIANSALQPSEGITGTAGFPKGIVAVVEPKPFFDPWIFILIGWAIVAVAAYGTIIYILVKSLQERAHIQKKQRIVAAWFDPPKFEDGTKFSPAETAAIVNYKTNYKGFTATIIHLAQRGYLKIVIRSKNDIAFVKRKEWIGDETVSSFERDFLNLIFYPETESEITYKKLKERLSKKATNPFTNIFKKVITNLYTAKMFKDNPNTKPVLIIVLLVFATVLTTPAFGWVLAIFAFIFQKYMVRMTDLGIEKYSEAQSLLNFLKSQKEQLDFQAHNQMFFEKLLPYATAFGVEKIWAERFKDLQFQPSDWYEGTGSGFNSMFYVTSLNSLNRAFIVMTTTTSSTGHSSGFSGGSSGGGGGGGGGGSW